MRQPDLYHTRSLDHQQSWEVRSWENRVLQSRQDEIQINSDFNDTKSQNLENEHNFEKYKLILKSVLINSIWTKFWKMFGG